jgi:hypothetical protein
VRLEFPHLPRVACLRQRPPLSALISPLLMLVVILAPAAVHAQGPKVASVNVTATPEGATATTSLDPAKGPYHPSRVLVRFRGGTDFLPGSAAPRSIPGPPQSLLRQEPGRPLCTRSGAAL